ncbi:MAG: P27 family phage terminase small subunit [Bacteroidales bacterium]|nr:P27 family phage terminase small subunit [Bacteroidales bacterium]
MDKRHWKTVIRKATVQVGTYQPAFDAVIDTLADILAKRDQAQKEFLDSGGEMLVVRTNKAGADNYEQNPMIRLINDFNRDALAFWRDLGLTPAGLKKINDEAVKKDQGSALDKVLSKLGG